MFCHFDADSFFASVLQRKNPKFRNRPLIAAGMGGGCVIAATYDLKKLGVKTGMRIGDAKKLCPRVQVVSSDFTETALASKQLQAILTTISPLVEQASIDEWYLDAAACVGGVPKNLEKWAQDIQNKLYQHTNLPISIGIAPTKILAKIASAYNKPKGIAIVQPHEDSNSKNTYSIPRFLQSLPIEKIPGIGSKRASHTHSFGWQTAYQFAQADPLIVQQLFGKPGLELQKEIQGELVYKVITESALPKSVSRARSFKPSYSKEFVLSYVFHHLSYIVLKMRRHNLMCNQVFVRVRDGTYQGYKGKDYKLPMPMDTESQLLPYVLRLFNRLFSHHAGCTQVVVGLSQLKPKAAKQFSLFEDPNTTIKDETIQTTLDTLHKQFGRDSIMYGSASLIKSGVRRGLPIIE